AARAAGSTGADRPEVVGLGAHLNALEVRARVQCVHRLGEEDVPNGARRGGVRVLAVVRLVVDEVDLAGVAGDHPREDRRVVRLSGEIDRRRPGAGQPTTLRVRVVDVLLALVARVRVYLGLRPVVVEVSGSIDRELDEDVARVGRVRQVGDLV